MAKTRSKRKRRKNMNAEQEKNTLIQEENKTTSQSENGGQDESKNVHLQGEEVTEILSKLDNKEKVSSGLQNCYSKLEVRSSPIEGYGVFATEDISSGDILEEIPFILWPRWTALGNRLHEALSGGNSPHAGDSDSWVCEREVNNEKVRQMFGFKLPEKYYFKWFPPNSKEQYSVIPLGFGPIYNSSNSRNNAGWKVNEKTFTFMATKDIKKDEEVCTFYGYFLDEFGVTYNVSDVFGLGCDLDRDGDGKVYLQVLRFAGGEEMEMCRKDAGFQKINELLGASNQKLRLRKISVVENNEEKHEFMFPDEWTLQFHFKKLKEFRFSRFKNIKLVLTYETPEQKKRNDKKRGKEGVKLEETGTEVIITNFVNG